MALIEKRSKVPPWIGYVRILFLGVGLLAGISLFLTSHAVSAASLTQKADSDKAEANNITVQYNVRIPMGDGVELSADVYRPSANGRYPVIVVRNPYTRASPQWDQRGRWWAENGFAFVIQDVRGRGDSDGKFVPFVNEAKDGIDTYNWASEQTWSTGKVGGWGGSYAAWTQLYPAAKGGAGLSALMPMAVPPDPDKSFPYANGIAIPATAVWLASIDGRLYQRLDGVNLASAYAERPLIDMDKRLGRHLPVWREWILSGGRSQYWSELSYQGDLLKKMDAPGLWVSGWYDDVLKGALDNFAALSKNAHSQNVRDRQWLIVGPWGHAINAGRKLGDIDFGSDAVIDLNQLQKRWFEKWLKGADNDVEKEPRVKLFVMGSNEWISEDEWPIARTHYTKYFLRSNGAANTLNGDGYLSEAPPGDEEKPDRFMFDPDDPVPYATGLDSTQMGGPDDYREIQERSDVLVYSTHPFKSKMRICGPLEVVLFASSSAKDTDWTAKLLDVHPDGYAQRLNDGIVRARFRNGTEIEEFLEPGKVEQYSIDMWATCIDMLPGHRLRVAISSSAAGKYDVNLNTGGDQGQESEGVVAEQKIYHDALRPSHIVVPIVPLEGS